MNLKSYQASVACRFFFCFFKKRFIEIPKPKVMRFYGLFHIKVIFNVNTNEFSNGHFEYFADVYNSLDRTLAD